MQVEQKSSPVPGFSLSVGAAGIKYADRKDMVLAEFAEGSVVSGVFTQNAFCAAPVHVAKKHLSLGHVRAMVINSGNANACTGDRGMQDALSSCQAVAQALHCKPEQVLPFSTGVIGEFLPVEKLNAAIPGAAERLSGAGWTEASQAIMTTDTRAKVASVAVELGGEKIVVTGMAKGAGMIRPNMATMLAYVATNAAIDQPLLDKLTKAAADKSFNRISIDGDTSTNDACMVVATGVTSSAKVADEQSAEYGLLCDAVIAVMQSLAHQIVKDGEGATKFVTIVVKGGESGGECLQVAYAIAHSPLVKTALYASDANWGRIVAAVGYAGIQNLNSNLVKVWLDDVLIVENGQRAASYSESAGSAVVALSEFSIIVDLGRGEAEEVLWTSDLSHEYVTINAEYRT